MEKEKILHYCWFGEKELPDKYKKNIINNKKFFPGYKVVIWNENNFDISSCTFSKQAYDMGEYAFVSDYVRAKVLFQHGGIYLDTDVEIIKKFPDIHEFKGFAAFERRNFLGTAVLGFNKDNEIIGRMVEYYESHNFIQNNGNTDRVANVSLFTDIMIESGLIRGGKEQEISEIRIYSREVFYPKKITESEFVITDETIAIHHCENSWLSDREKRRGNSKFWIEIIRPLLQKLRRISQNIIGEKLTRKIEIALRNRLK